MGLSTAYCLSKNQKKILLIDQFPIENGLNASWDYSKNFRYVYGDDKYYTKLAIKSLKQWKILERESNTQLYFKSGCLLLGESDSSYAKKSYETMKSLKLDSTLLTRRDLRNKFPQFNSRYALLDPNGGVIEADTAVKALNTLAKKNGVKIKSGCKVVKIKKNSVILQNGEEILAEKIIITAGSWSQKLTPIKLHLNITKQEVVYLKPKNLENFNKKNFPTFGYIDSKSGLYGIPIHKIHAVKIASHIPGKAVDPDKVSRKIGKSFISECRKFLSQYIPDLTNADVIESKICLYDMTPDENFILDKLNNNTIIGTGFSGHGFKFAPVIGMILADLATSGKTDFDIARFRLRRF